MNGDRLQSHIYRGNAKGAAHIGDPYQVYRYVDPIAPMDDVYKIAVIPATFSAEQRFVKPNKYQIPTWFCFADGRLLQPRDILVGIMGTFYIGDMQRQLPIQAIQTNHVVSVGRGTYTTTGSVEQVVEFFATRLPIFMQFRREDIKQSQYANTIGQAITHWTAFIPLPEGMLKQDDVVEDEEGIRYVVDAPDFTSIGYAAHLRLITI